VLDSLPEHDLTYEPGWHEATTAVRAGAGRRNVPAEACRGRTNGARRARRAPYGSKEHLLPAQALTGMAYRLLEGWGPAPQS